MTNSIKTICIEFRLQIDANSLENDTNPIEMHLDMHANTINNENSIPTTGAPIHIISSGNTGTTKKNPIINTLYRST